MVDAFDDVYFYSFVEVKNNNYSFVEVKNNNSRYYTYLEDNKSSYVSLLEYESDIPQKFDSWNKTQTEVLTVEEFESKEDLFIAVYNSVTSNFEEAKEAVEESVKSYKKSLKEKRTYVKTGNEYTLSIYDKDGELQSRITYKRMSKGDAEERWDDYKDAIKDYKKDLKKYSDQYDNYKDHFDYGYGSDSESGSNDSDSSKKRN